jgi:hypothetical protein
MAGCLRSVRGDDAAITLDGGFGFLVLGRGGAGRGGPPRLAGPGGNPVCQDRFSLVGTPHILHFLHVAAHVSPPITVVVFVGVDETSTTSTSNHGVLSG